MSDLRENFIDELKDVFDAEKQLVKALPKMARAAESPELKQAFEEHLMQTEGQVDRLEKIFDLVGEPARGKKCKGMQGLIEEGSEHIEEEAGDAVLICAAQKVEHYEIATYGCLCAWAEQLGFDDVVPLLKETLEEEKTADQLLSTLAEASVNIEAEEEMDVEKKEDKKMSAGKPGGRRKK